MLRENFFLALSVQAYLVLLHFALLHCTDTFFCFVLFYKFILFFQFWLRWVFFVVCRLSLVAVSGGYSSLQFAGFSLQWLLLFQSTGSRRTGFSSCGLRALERRLSSCDAWDQLLRSMWDLPGPGLEPVSPALAGGFLTTVPTEKPSHPLYDATYSVFFWVMVSQVWPQEGAQERLRVYYTHRSQRDKVTTC